MRSVFPGVCRRAAALAIVTLLLIPTVGLADDSQPRPPWPQSVLQPAVTDDSQAHPPWPSVWHVLLVVIASSRIAPFVN